MSKRILFVDDETLVLSGLQRSLRSMRKEWEMEFVAGGLEALKAMERSPFDVVISDMRMPGMDGAELLEMVKQRFPQTVRMVLSGQSEKEAVLRAIRSTHQYLSKPCDIDELKQKLSRALDLRDGLDDPKLKAIVSRVEAIPSLPGHYHKLRELLALPNSPLDDVAAVVAQDMGMTAKLLQLVNSSFLGIAPRLSSPKQAVSVLGFDNLRLLTLSLNLFSELPTAFRGELEIWWKQSCTTAAFAKTIARCEGVAENGVQDSFTAGLLHPIGRVVLALASGNQRRRPALGNCEQKSESDAWGGRAAHAGAYLLGLWGLPPAVVEAVAWHEAPKEAHPAGYSPLIAVHAALFFYGELQADKDGAKERQALDEVCLAETGLHQRLAVWREQCRSVLEKGGESA